MSNKLHIKPQPLTEDERRQQAMRLAAQKYESFYTGLVFNMVQNPAFDGRRWTASGSSRTPRGWPTR